MPTTKQIIKAIQEEKQRIIQSVLESSSSSKSKGKGGEKPPKNFSLYKAIRGEKQGNNEGEASLYKANTERRDKSVRKFVDEHVERSTNKAAIPGQLLMFDYFEPKTKEDLEYYDAMPCTIFFNIVKTKDGPRVLGFNLHYYPPSLRFQIMSRIFEIFRPIYEGSWNNPIQSEISGFDYNTIIKLLQKENLEFGVRMYIPNLMHRITPIPPKYYQKAVFTEGHFKQQTRAQIFNFWKKWLGKRAK